MNTKYTPIFILLHPLLMPFPFSLTPLPHTRTYRNWFTFLSIFQKCILIVQGVFALVVQTCIYCTLIRLDSPITYYFSIQLLPDYSIAYSAFCYIVFMHKSKVSIFFTLQHSLSLSCLPIYFKYREYPDFNMSTWGCKLCSITGRNPSIWRSYVSVSPDKEECYSTGLHDKGIVELLSSVDK
jgi:hypothetical protein